MTGAFLAFLSACLQGANSACLRRGVLTGTASQAMAITVPIGVPLALLAAWLSGQLFQFGELSLQGTFLLASAGILQYVWGRYWNYRATAALGSVGAGPIQQSQMWIAVLFAVLVLGESLTKLKLLGMTLVFISPLIIAYSIKRQNRLKAESAATNTESAAGQGEIHFKPEILLGYGSALLAALGYGISPVLIRSGLEETGLGILGGLIAYSSATITFALIACIVPGQIRHIRQTDRRSLPWYTLAGVLVYVAQTLYFTALSLAPVTVVAPIHQFSMVARVCAGYVINRKHEVFSPTIIFAVLLSLMGTIILAADWNG
ncbi:EamA family transporter [Marinobacter sp. BSs20148]|uniref:DMT family transporter n=1 Tax=Marinobacter sp. BSs20148 TaxID=490759 RepID=UPI0002F8F6BE|nr:EamA family transporter [Marinobacter sp. BSs20148]